MQSPVKLRYRYALFAHDQSMLAHDWGLFSLPLRKQKENLTHTAQQNEGDLPRIPQPLTHFLRRAAWCPPPPVCKPSKSF